jgi:general secretion pathway protein G
MKNKKNKGFTLVELLVVIAIIAILVVLILVALGVARQKARDSQRKTDLHSIQTALELYADDHGGVYPQSGSLYTPATLSTYMNSVPTDPLKNSAGATVQYGYSTDDASGNKTYILCAKLEQKGTAASDKYTTGAGDQALIDACVDDATSGQ